MPNQIQSVQPALVGIVPRENLWNVIQKEGWYHIPVEAAPNNITSVEYIAFYFPEIFGVGRRYKVNYYANVQKINIVKRIQLFPNELEHKRVQKDYYQFHIGEIKELPKPIPSRKLRHIIHIPTTYQKLFSAKEINDLYDTSPIEDKMHQAMKESKIEAERQVYTRAGGQNYCLDFGIFCRQGNIDVECDGEKYHTLPDALARDRERNNHLASFGWRVLRFSGKEIHRVLQNCLGIVKTTINNLGGLN